MYLREFGRLVAQSTAVPGVLGVPMDPAVSVMLSLSQLLTATWRRAVSTATPNERREATVAVRLAASVLGPLYASLKPFDPEPKGSGVFNLYLHTAIAHVGATLGRAFPTANHACDDHIEGKISELNRYFRTGTKNASRGESLINKEDVQPMQFSKARGRTAV